MTRNQLIATALLAMLLGGRPAHAAPPPPVDGSIEYYGNGERELAAYDVLEYARGGCIGNHTEGTFAAIVDLRPFRGRIVELSAMGARTDLNSLGGGTSFLRARFFNGCPTVPSQQALVPAYSGYGNPSQAFGPWRFVAQDDFLMIMASQNFGTRFGERFHFEQVCPQDDAPECDD